MSPLSSLKRLSIGSTKSTSAKSSNCSAQVNGHHPSPLDITFALNFQQSSPISPWASTTPSNDGRHAEMLEDDNMSWSPSKPPSSPSKRSRRRTLRFF